MTKPQWSRAVSIGGTVLIVAALLVGFLPGPSASAADVDYTAKASARGLRAELLGVSVLDDQLSPRTANTDRVAPFGPGNADCTETAPPAAPACRQGPKLANLIGLPLLDNVLSVGVVAQDAAVDNLGNSNACAGVVGAGGQVDIDASPNPCVVAPGQPIDPNKIPTNPGGVVLNLADPLGLPLGLLRLRIDGIYSECSATAGNPLAVPPVPPSARGIGRVANIVVDTKLPLGGWRTLASVPVSPGPNAQILFPGVLAPLSALVSLTVNEQIPPPPAAGPDTRTQIEVAALHLTVAGGAVADVRAGIVSCGANAFRNNTGTTTTTSSTTTSSTSSTTSTSTTSTSSTTSTTLGPATTTTSTTSTTLPDIDPGDPGVPGEDGGTDLGQTALGTDSGGSTTSTTVGGGSTTGGSTSGSTTSGATTGGATTGGGTSGATSGATTGGAGLAKSGVNTRTQLAMAMGLLGLGMVVSSRGMQLGFDGPGRRRR